MSVALLVTAGYGNGTLSGDINDVVTRGYIAGEEVAVEALTGGVKSRKVKFLDVKSPWTQDKDDWVDAEIKAAQPKRKKLTLKTTPFEPAIDEAIRIEFERVDRERKEKRRKRRKAIEMLLLS